MERARPPAEPRPASSTAHGPGRGAWLVSIAVPLAAFGALALAFGATRAAPAWLAGATLLAILALVVGWILTSVLWPGRADRTCPSCGAEAVERLDAGDVVGRRCGACGWREAAESAWLLAEEDGEALEPLVLRRRRERRSGRGRQGGPGALGS